MARERFVKRVPCEKVDSVVKITWTEPRPLTGPERPKAAQITYTPKLCSHSDVCKLPEGPHDPDCPHSAIQE
jgi:hypothetical protein